MKHNIDVEKRFLLQIFNCTQEQLTKILDCIRKFKEKFDHDLIRKLLCTISDRNDGLFLEYERNHYDFIIGSIGEEFIIRYFAEKGISLDFEFFETFYEFPSEIENYISEYGISSNEWKKFRIAYDLFQNK